MHIIIRCIIVVTGLILAYRPLRGEDQVIISDVHQKIEALKQADLAEPLLVSIEAFQSLTSSRSWKSRFGAEEFGQLVELGNKVARFEWQIADALGGELGWKQFEDVAIQNLAAKSQNELRKVRKCLKEIEEFYAATEEQIQPALFAKKYGFRLANLPENFIDNVEESSDESLILTGLHDLTPSQIKEIGKDLNRKYIVVKGNAADSLDESIASAFAATGRSLIIMPVSGETEDPHTGPAPEIVKSLSTTAANLAFPSVTHVTADFARAVADHTGVLAMKGLRSIEAGAGQHLSNHKGRLVLCNSLADLIRLHDSMGSEDWLALAGAPSLEGAFGKVNEELNRRKAAAAEIEKRIAALGGKPKSGLGRLEFGETIEGIQAKFPPGQTFVVDPHAGRGSVTNAPEWMLIEQEEPRGISLLAEAFLFESKFITPNMLYVYANGAPPGMEGISRIRFACHQDFGCIEIRISYNEDVPPTSIQRILDERFGKSEGPSMTTKDKTVRDVQIRQNEIIVGPAETRTEVVGMKNYWTWRPEDGVEFSCGILKPAVVQGVWKRAINAAEAGARQSRDNMNEARDKAAGSKLGL
jgi:hypothetical protein